MPVPTCVLGEEIQNTAPGELEFQMTASIPHLGSRHVSDFCELIVDCEHKTAPIQSDGYPSIRTPNIGRGYFLLDEVNRVSEETYRLWTRRARPQPGDLIMAREAPVGNVAVIPEGLEPCLGQRTLLLRPDRAKVDPAFLAYLLISPPMQERIHALTNGATVPHLNMKDIRGLPLPLLPPLAIQRRMSGILSAYDDLIEKSLQRIRILDKMARTLYREWFVLLRYPQHERAPLADSTLGRIPKDWSVVAVDDVKGSERYAINGGPFGSKLGVKDYRPHGVPVIRGSNLTESGRFRSDEFVFISEEKAFELNANLATPGDIVVTQRGTLGQIGMIPADIGYAKFVISQSQMKITVDPEKVDREYVFFALSSPEANQRIKNLASSSGVPHINLAVLRQFQILCPPVFLQRRFGEFVRSTERAIEVLNRQVDLLRRTRDLLLPRLLSGHLALEPTG